MSDISLYTVGGTIPTEGRIYIQRQADEELLALCRAGTLAYVLSTRQVGKSSLMVRTAQQLEAEGTRCALVDLSLLGTEFDGAEWYLGLLSLISDALEPESDLERWWEDHAHGHACPLPPFGDSALGVLLSKGHNRRNHGPDRHLSG